MVKSRLIAIIALCTTFFALGVIALGAFTRLVDAGLGCPDWPLCYGHFVVPTLGKAQTVISSQYPESHFVAYKAWAEMIHRYFVGALSLLIVSLVFFIFKIKRSRSNMILAIFLLLLLTYQILLGQWTVTLKLLPIIVTQHLLGGFLILSVVWVIYLNNKEYSHRTDKSQNREAMRQSLIKPGYFAMIGLAILFLQITLGAWTSTNYASLSCSEFPWCNSDHIWFSASIKDAFHLLPVGINYEGGVLSTPIRQTIQMMHRLGAFIFTLYMMIFTCYTIPKFKNSFALLKALYCIWGLIFIQISLGITNVLFKLPVFTAICHNLVGVLLLLFIITLTYRLISFRTS